MIHILHGQDQTSSYSRLSQIIKSYKNYSKLNLTEKNTFEDFQLAVFSKSTVFEKEIIICDNFLLSKKVTESSLKEIPKDKVVIFWEKGILDSRLLTKTQNLAKIENFKPQLLIFHFLDSISPNFEKSLRLLYILDYNGEPNLIWHLQNRLLLLILAKHQINYQTTVKITQKDIADWQWQKIQDQSRLFDLGTLVNLYNGIVKIDFIKKSGTTNLKDTSLLCLLLLKYLRPLSANQSLSVLQLR